jgi:phosphatidylglycerophosphate synthase
MARLDEASPSAHTCGRRPLRSRDTDWARAAAQRLGTLGVRPNQISLASVGFAALAAGGLGLAPRVEADLGIALYLGAALSIQLRLLANLLDGMVVALDGRRESPTGELFNEVPDRVADVLVLVAAGYTVAAGPWPALGWTAAVLALLTAYIRALGTALGAAPRCDGPMAKPQRMAVMTVACLLAALETGLGTRPLALALGLGVVIVGGAVTMIRRLRAIAEELTADRPAGGDRRP